MVRPLERLLLVLLLASPGLAPSASGSDSVRLYMSEACHRRLDARKLHLANGTHVLPEQVVCAGGPDSLAELVSRPGARLLASPEPELCEPAHWLAALRHTVLITWTCPQELRFESRDVSRRLAPPVQETATALAAIVHSMRWKNVAIVHADFGWWQSLAHALDLALRKWGLLYKHLVSVSSGQSLEDVTKSLEKLKRTPCRAILVCASADGTGYKILDALDQLRLSELYESLTILVDVSTLPMWLPTFYHNSSTNETGYHTKKYILLFTNGEPNLSPINYTDEALLADRISKGMALLSNKRFALESKYVVLDLKDDDTWRPLIKVARDNGSDYVVDKFEDNFEEWVLKHSSEEECDNCNDMSSVVKTTQVLLVFLCSSLFVGIVIGITALARNQVLKKRISKGPYKVLLTAADFVFPQVTDSRRVDEGIEAMLCCWLQQLQEFGGPEVDKPDLLKGSVGSLKGHNAGTKSGGSGGSMTRALLVDPRVRYNGDLVQMKLLAPTSGSSGGAFELKTKALEFLVTLHGLRHENLNPVIGCLTEPARPALVWEWCSRGSLEDVLVMDEIKLDWSFRLSLLTDLVRGMKYLHSSPVKVHGYLTSRNCVIDARWVLKVTDYGLPCFYEAQGITPPTKTARELLWTAPELLRHMGLRKKGSQPGDVYSFGIIMQEVVVRGEPFCMLALTPEEIIEKVKRPPPLIRPSVSKGAAPPEAINIMRQCWAEQAEMRPDFTAVHDLFKKLNHGRKVNFVDTMFQMLEKYSNNLEELIRERTSQLDMEKKKTEQLLNRMLPSSVAEKLKLGMPVDPEEFAEVTIYFSDIVGFTTISAYSTPFQVVDLLNDLYTCFDATINAYNVYKVETIGDAYMVVGGLPVRISDHAEQIATMALDLLHQSGKFKIRHLPKTPLRLRIGLHTGPCCAGVVGLTMPRYCLFGDTVNTASRMESTGSPWRIHLSQTTKERLEKAGGYQLEYRGPTEVKGKGCMQTYWLLGKSGFDKQLPVPPPIGESHGLDESIVICARSDSSRTNSFHNKSEENSSADGSLSQAPSSPKTHESTVVRVSAHVHSDQPRTFQTLEASKLMKEQTLTGFLADLDDPRDLRKDMADPTFIRHMESSKFTSIISKTGSEMEVAKDKPQDFTICGMIKSTSSDTQTSLGTPVSSSELSAALLCASSTSLSNSTFRNRHRRVGVIEEDDLSTPYNHYRCLSPIDKSGESKNNNRMLKRQFSLDRGDDPASETSSNGKLHKQNSAGAAHDLEMIEEVPLKAPTPSPCHRKSSTPHSCSISVSVDSLSLH